jgi:hypothetical protein
MWVLQVGYTVRTEIGVTVVSKTHLVLSRCKSIFEKLQLRRGKNSILVKLLLLNPDPEEPTNADLYKAYLRRVDRSAGGRARRCRR